MLNISNLPEFNFKQIDVHNIVTAVGSLRQVLPAKMAYVIVHIVLNELVGVLPIRRVVYAVPD